MEALVGCEALFLLGSDAGELAGREKSGVTVQSSLGGGKDFDVFIDFTRPEGTLTIRRFAASMVKGW